MLIETAYLPPISWLSAVWSSDTITLEACEHFQKGSWRNRCHIAGPNGMHRLSIPLEQGKHQQTPIREVRISYAERWSLLHWRSIQAAYGNAPYFEFYADELRAIYQSKPVFLFDFNEQLIAFLLKKLDWKGQITSSTSYLELGNADVDFRGLVIPKNAGLFPVQPYAQVFQERHGFLPDLSALDLLMCCGKQGRFNIESTL